MSQAEKDEFLNGCVGQLLVRLFMNNVPPGRTREMTGIATQTGELRDQLLQRAFPTSSLPQKLFEAEKRLPNGILNIGNGTFSTTIS
jgi:hypothetical protein